MELYSFHALHRSKVSAIMTFYRVIAIAMIISRLDSINKIGLHVSHCRITIPSRHHTMHIRCMLANGFQRAICSRCSILWLPASTRPTDGQNGDMRIASGAALITLSSCEAQIDSMATMISSDNSFSLLSICCTSQPQSMTNHFKFRI